MVTEDVLAVNSEIYEINRDFPRLIETFRELRENHYHRDEDPTRKTTFILQVYNMINKYFPIFSVRSDSTELIRKYRY